LTPIVNSFDEALEGGAMNDPFFFRYLLDVSYHVAEFAKVTWEPWTDAEHNHIGWQGKHADDKMPDIFVYLVPEVDAPHPTVAVYYGFTGDPSKDDLMMLVEDDR
jgi:hypothetical protein